MRGIVGPLHPVRVLQLVALLAPPLSVVAPRSLAIVLPMAALLAAAGAWREGALRWPPRSPALLLAAFAIWSAASAVWAVHPALVWSIWAQTVGLGAAGLILLGIGRGIDDGARLPIGLALAAGVATALGLLLAEWASSLLLDRSFGSLLFTRRPFDTYVFNRAAASLAVFVWPAAYAVHLRFGRRAAASLVLVTMLIVSQFASMAAILGLAGGLAVWLAVAWRPYPAAAILAAAIVIGAATAPWLPRVPAVASIAERNDVSVSIYHRLEIWRFAAEAIAQRPIAGWGLNASRELPGGRQLSASGHRLLPLHPHNALLQLWLELGMVGAALGTLLLLAAIRGAMRLDSEIAAATGWARASAAAAIASGTLVAAVGYGIWQAWWMAALWIAAALMAAAAKSQARR